jgi:hypothetical protein
MMPELPRIFAAAALSVIAATLKKSRAVRHAVV